MTDYLISKGDTFKLIDVGSPAVILYFVVLDCGYRTTCQAQSHIGEPLRLGEIIMGINPNTHRDALVERTTDGALDGRRYLLCDWEQIPRDNR